ARAGRLAARRDRPREHARRLRRQAAAEASRARWLAGDRHRSRRRLRNPMSRIPFPRSVRGRLLVAVVAAVALALAAMIAGFNLLLARSLSSNADQVVHARAAAELANLDPSGGRLKLREAPDDAAADSPVWV